MKTLLAAAVALSAVSFGIAAPARADVVVRTPGVTTESEPYWRGHENWRAQREFREHQYQQESWMRDHCVRDWSGAAYCRR